MRKREGAALREEIGDVSQDDGPTPTGCNLVSSRQLRAARALAGLTQKTLGDAIGVTERAVGSWERSKDTNPMWLRTTSGSRTCCVYKAWSSSWIRRRERGSRMKPD